jgi:signal transduction histidine kinase/CheY-like chemotaxis protein/PAS domain-containing protein
MVRAVRRSRFITLLALLLGAPRLLLPIPVARAATAPPPPVPLAQEASWRIVNFAADAGVQRRMVFDVAFQPGNLAWFASSDGLYRYDGYRWDRFTAADGLPSSFVRTVFVDRDGNLWVGTDRGAGVFAASTFDRRGTADRIAGPNVRRIVQTSDGALWFCCDRWPNMDVRGGLTRLHQGSLRTFGLAEGLPSEHVLDLFEQSNGRLIALTGDGPAVREGERWTPFAEPGFPAAEHTWAFHEAPDGRLFAEAYDSTLTRHQDRWIPVFEAGLSRFSPLCVTRDGSVLRVHHRVAGRLAFTRWDGSTFVKASADLPDPGVELLVVRQAPDGAIWAVGRGAILRWDYLPGPWTWRPDLPAPILEDSARRLWFAEPQSIVLLDDDRVHRFPDVSQPIAEDAEGAVWAVATNGLVRWNGGQLEPHPETSSGIRDVEGLLADAAGTLWAHGRASNGHSVLARARRGSWASHGTDRLVGRRITDAAADAASGIWIILHSGKSLDYEIARVTTNTFDLVPVAGHRPPIQSPNLSVGHRHLQLYGYNGLWESPLGPELRFAQPRTEHAGVFAAGASIGDVSAFLAREGVDGSAAILVRRADEWLLHRVRFAETLSPRSRGMASGCRWRRIRPLADPGMEQPRLSRPPHRSRQHHLPPAQPVGRVLDRHPPGNPPLLPVLHPPRDPARGTSHPSSVTASSASAPGASPPSFPSPAPCVSPSPGASTRIHGPDSATGPGRLCPSAHEPTARIGSRFEPGMDWATRIPTPALLHFAVVPIPIQDRAWFRPALAAVGLGFGSLCLALTRVTRRLRRHAGHLEDEVQARTAQLVADLDQRERMARALRESESRLLANLENTPNVGVQWYDGEGRVVYWNRASETIYGWKSRGGPGETPRGHHPRSRGGGGLPGDPRPHSPDRRTGGPVRTRHPATGRHRLLDSRHHTFAIPLNQGEAGFACMDVDITERKHDERVQQAIARISEVALSARTLDELFASIHGVISELMPAPNFYVALLDREGAQIDFPYFRDDRNPPPPARRLGRGLTEFVLRTGRPLLVSTDQLEELARQGEVIPQTPNPVTWLGVPLRTQERTIGVVAVQSYEPSLRYVDRDRELLSLVSYHVANAIERKRAEQHAGHLQAQLVQAQKMESVGRLAGGVAHDFNNMLQTILGNVELAMEQAPAPGPLHDDLREIRGAAERSADLTRQLLAFARKQTIRPRRLDLNETVGGMLRMLRRLIGEDLHLVWMPGPNLWPVKVDPSQVDQILANLCVNARDAIDGVGRVTIETANVSLDDACTQIQPDAVPGDYVLLAVSDDGRGMDAETQRHLFEPFFTTKAVGEGTGLGLATVYGIVKQNGGLIGVASRLHHGTTFRIYLPRNDSDPPPAPLPNPTRSLGGSETILLVEDETQVLSLGRRILEQRGYTVLGASHPLTALSLASQHPGTIHLLITDVVMPGVNGRELRDRLRVDRPALRCLFMSGYTADVIADHGILDEGIEFLQKPFDIHGLAEKVRQILDRDRSSPTPLGG